MANLKAYEGTGTRYDPYLYDLLEARVAWTDYQRAIVSRKSVKKGLPRNLGGVSMGDFSSGKGRKPVVLKDVEPTKPAKPAEQTPEPQRYYPQGKRGAIREFARMSKSNGVALE